MNAPLIGGLTGVVTVTGVATRTGTVVTIGTLIRATGDVVAETGVLTVIARGALVVATGLAVIGEDEVGTTITIGETGELVINAGEFESFGTVGTISMIDC